MYKEFSSEFSSDPLDIINTINHDPFLSKLPHVDNVVRVSGGVVHHVYQITSDEKRYYLKIRGATFAQIPEISCNPDDIINEYNALILLGGMSPENFPRAMSFNSGKSYLVLSDAMPDGELLEKLFLEGRVTSDIMFHLGATLKKIHSLSRSYNDDLRANGDTAHYEKKLLDRFGYRQNPVLDGMVDDLRREDRQLILGDVAPKNIGVNNEGKLFIFFDLEDAHRGNAIFDYGYLIGHILLHTFTFPESAIEDIEAFCKGYNSDQFDEGMIKKIALGIILYRLGSIVPYQTNLTSSQKLIIQQRIERILSNKLISKPWGEIISTIRYEEN